MIWLLLRRSLADGATTLTLPHALALAHHNISVLRPSRAVFISPRKYRKRLALARIRTAHGAHTASLSVRSFDMSLVYRIIHFAPRDIRKRYAHCYHYRHAFVEGSLLHLAAYRQHVSAFSSDEGAAATLDDAHCPLYTQRHAGCASRRDHFCRRLSAPLIRPFCSRGLPPLAIRRFAQMVTPRLRRRRARLHIIAIYIRRLHLYLLRAWADAVMLAGYHFHRRKSFHINGSHLHARGHTLPSILLSTWPEILAPLRAALMDCAAIYFSLR